MKTIVRRVRRLENQLGTGDGKQRILLVDSMPGCGLIQDQERCVQILDECGFLPSGSIGLVNLTAIPDGLNAEEAERFLRENGAEICGFRGVQAPGEPTTPVTVIITDNTN